MCLQPQQLEDKDVSHLCNFLLCGSFFISPIPEPNKLERCSQAPEWVTVLSCCLVLHLHFISSDFCMHVSQAKISKSWGKTLREQVPW